MTNEGTRMSTVTQHNLEGQRALVTGATSGIGRAAALQLASDGAEVLVHGRDAARGAATVQEITVAGGKASFVAADLADADDVRWLASEAGDVDILINNAGIAMFGATAGFDNDYGAQAQACIRSLADLDLFVLHIEATDEAGHQGRSDIKVDALERWDTDVIGPIVDALDAGSEPYRILLLPDHATPCTIKTHTAESVPYLLFDSTRDAGGGGR